MKYVALVSGGKDSVFAILELHALGHELVCAANLAPPEGVEEPDSYMFQCAGHDAVQVLAEECLGVPLIRQQLKGSSSHIDIDYEPTEGDEVEDLLELLQRVKDAHPDVQGVSTGAILSTYQRIRVENVCERLGLSSLAPLWRQSQAPLLHDMVTTGVNAVLVKVSSLGLDPRRHMGKSIADLEPFFLTLNSKHQFHVCGEGGEYETLVLDCPLFRRRLVLDETKLIFNEDDGHFAPVGFLKVVRCHSEAKEAPSDSEGLHLTPRISPLVQLKDFVNRASYSKPAAPLDSPVSSVPPVLSSPAALAKSQHMRTGRHNIGGGIIHLAQIIGAAGKSPEEQVKACLDEASRALEERGSCLGNVVFVHLYLSQMSDFQLVNAAYCKYFANLRAPSRSCVSIVSTGEAKVMLDCLAMVGAGEGFTSQECRNVLHVKSLSRWAPVCIGPYSQANILCSGGLLLISGQIGLDPASMSLVEGGLPSEILQSVLNSARVIEAAGSTALPSSSISLSSSGVLCITVYVSLAGVDEGLWRSMGWWDWIRDQIAESVKMELGSKQEDPMDRGDIPIICIGVPELPKGSLCELEVIASAPKMLELLGDKRLHKDWCWNSVADHGVDGLSWLDDPAGGQGPPLRWGLDKMGGEVLPGLTASISAAYIPKCLCLGFFSLAAPPKVDSDSPTGDMKLDSLEVGVVVAQALSCALSAAGLLCTHLTHLRVYAVNPGHEVDSILQQCISHLTSQEELYGSEPAATVVPCAALWPGCVLAVQLMAMDLPQMQTQIWVRNSS